MIPQNVVEEVRARADIVEIVGEAVQLKRSGREYKARCPFHNEKTPSFYVVPAKGFYKCFGCGESGDVFTFLMKRQGLSFQEAVRVIAAKVGVEIPVDDDRRGDEPNKVLYEVTAFAAEWFKTNLWDAVIGEKARAYLEQRGITKATAERFGMGYAPDTWRGLREAAHKHGITDAVLLDAGLIKESEKSEKKDDPYDRFRDRIIWPVAETTGRTVAFGGRILKKSENAPKYLNSPETPIYQKGRILYGLNWSRAAIRREEFCIIVEGYMDYVALASVGIENLAAGMGTAMTREQAALCARYARKAVLLYDSDTAGLKATFRSGDALLQAGVVPLVVTLPEGQDPDSLVRTAGREALVEAIAQAKDIVDKKIEILEEHGYFSGNDRILEAVNRLMPTIRATADPALKDIYISRVEEKTGVRRRTLEAALTSDKPIAPPASRPPRNDDERRGGRDRRSAAPTRPSESERLLVLFLMKDRSRLDDVRPLVYPNFIADPQLREIFQWLMSASTDANMLSDEAGSVYAVLEKDQTPFGEGDRALVDFMAGIKVPFMRAKVHHLRRLLDDPTVPDVEKDEVFKEHTELQTELKKLATKESSISFKASRSRGFKRRPPNIQSEQSE